MGSEQRSDNTERNYQTDVLVIGFGGAGGCAAIEAFDHGAEVMMIEKQKKEKHYSNTRMSGGAYHCPQGDPEAIKEYALAMFSGSNLPWKLEGELSEEIAQGFAEAWAEYAPDNLAWMKSIDPEYGAYQPENANLRDAAFTQFPGAEESGYKVLRSTYSGVLENTEKCQRDDPKSIKESGEAFHACLQHGIDDRGIDVHWNTSAVEFFIDDEGGVLGVIAENDDQKLIYEAGATILTTGGFEYNKNLRMNFLEGPGVEGWAFYGTPSNTGDGILMSMDIGANLSKVNKAASRMITAIPIRKSGLKMGLRTPVIGRPNAIVVDTYGNRYAAERKITEDPTRYFFYKEGVKFDIDNLVYPRIPSWLIFDETLRTKRAVVGLRGTGYHDIEWGKDNMKAIEKGWILKAQTIERLAGKIQDHPDNRSLMERDNLTQTIDTYNRYCKQGVDKDFDSNPKNMGPVKMPPYYALPLYPGGPNTKGGLMANAAREVLDKEGDPISGLYTAGEISSVFKFVYQGGGNLAECIVFGRIAGENAAQRVMNL